MKLINSGGRRHIVQHISLPAQSILWCCCFCLLHRPIIWISHREGAPTRPLAAPLLPWLKQVSRKVVFVNDSLHLNSCHSSVKGRGGGENVCFRGLQCTQNASLLHKLNLALQMSRQSFRRSIPVKTLHWCRQVTKVQTLKGGKTHANLVESICLHHENLNIFNERTLL